MAVAIRGLLVGDLSPSTAAELVEQVELMLAASRDAENSESESPHEAAKRKHTYLEHVFH